MIGRCTAGDACKFIHVYDAQKVPLCEFAFEEGACPDGKGCMFRHAYLDEEEKRRRRPRWDPARVMPQQ